MKVRQGIFELFQNRPKASSAFYKWYSSSDDFSENDVERLENCITLPALNVFRDFENALLDFLEEHGYYIGTPLRGCWKYVTVVHKNRAVCVKSSTLIFSNSGHTDRTTSIYKGVDKSLEHLEKKL